MLLLLAHLAFASPDCAEIEGLIAEATQAFDEARVDDARARLAAASEALRCQQQVVSRETLLELYQLDALASVADQDPKAALFAIIRSVTLDPSAAPPEDVGPELIEQHSQWAARLEQDMIRVSATRTDIDVWVDGEPLGLDPIQVISGEHLVQVRDGGVWSSGFHELIVDRVPAGLPLSVSRMPRPAPIAPEIGKEPELPPPPPARRKRVGLGVGLGMAVAGAAFVGGGYLLERRFADDPYNDPVYGDCTRAQSCWTSARADQIAADARRANALYLTGYGLAGLGLTISGVDLATSRTGASLRLRGTFR